MTCLVLHCHTCLVYDKTMTNERIEFRGFHLKREEVGTSRPAINRFDAIAIPVFHSRREAWKFLRGWSKGLTTKQLKRKGYFCLPVKVLREAQ